MKNKRILFFDDNTDILDLCTLILESAGYEIKTSATANLIIDQVIKYKPDLIFMDNCLPDVGGVSATQTLKNHPALKHIPVIYFTANNDVQILAKQAGADNYLAKPFDINALENLVQSYLK